MADFEDGFLGLDRVVDQHDLPNVDQPSPNNNPPRKLTKKQALANNLSRCIELQVFFGSTGQAFILNMALDEDHLNSDEATERALVSNVFCNATGLLTAFILHRCLRSSYRTGEYQFKLSTTGKPQATELAEMKSNDIFIYVDEGHLHYLIKKPFRSLIEGQIPLDEDKPDEDLQKLKTLLSSRAELSPLDIPPSSLEAFKKLTEKRGHTHSGGNSTNPLYRACKTLSAFGARLGAVLSIFVGVHDPNKRRLISFIMSDIFCVVFGLFGVCYFVVRDKILKIPPYSNHPYASTGRGEGWSKYAKTALTFGTAIGQGIGGLVIGIAAHHTTATISSFSIAFWGGIVGVGSFIIAIVAIPLVNWLSAKRGGKGILTSENKNVYRNNYTRSGFTLGAGLGACLGLLTGHYLFGMIVAANIFSALGAVIGGVLLSVYGHKIHRYMHTLPEGKTDNDEDLENSWDYASRSMASVFGYIGAAIACAINPAAALLLAPIGAMIASALGWCLGILVVRVARRLPGNTEERRSTTLPWTQRITMGANIGSTIGSCLGFVIGLTGTVLAGPAAIIFAVSLFGAIGALIGGVVGALYDKRARGLIWQAINPWSQPSEDDSQSSGNFPRPRYEPSTTAQIMIYSPPQHVPGL
ncbi:MAG TPA: hypothetical protein VLH77_05720, partial [Gammaproteobacteria bacterium]|nr:hypothetical protein [Gammaproteobacteria bacterium]